MHSVEAQRLGWQTPAPTGLLPLSHMLGGGSKPYDLSVGQALSAHRVSPQEWMSATRLRADMEVAIGPLGCHVGGRLSLAPGAHVDLLLEVGDVEPR